jgi:hypothetical protein
MPIPVDFWCGSKRDERVYVGLSRVWREISGKMRQDDLRGPGWLGAWLAHAFRLGNDVPDLKIEHDIEQDGDAEKGQSEKGKEVHSFANGL